MPGTHAWHRRHQFAYLVDSAQSVTMHVDRRNEPSGGGEVARATRNANYRGALALSALLRSTMESSAAVTIAYLIVSARLIQLGVTIQCERHRDGRDFYWDSDARTLWMRPDAHVASKLWVVDDLHQLMTGPADYVSRSIPDLQLRLIRGGAN